MPGENRGLFIVPKPAPQAAMPKLITHSATGQVMIRSEFSERLEALTSEYLAEYKPNGITEVTLVRDLAVAECRSEYALQLLAQPAVSGNEKMAATLDRYRTTNQVLFRRSLKALRSIQRTRQRQARRKPQLVKPRITGEC
jgi:hypothetical protein